MEDVKHVIINGPNLKKALESKKDDETITSFYSRVGNMKSCFSRNVSVSYVRSLKNHYDKGIIDLSKSGMLRDIRIEDDNGNISEIENDADDNIINLLEILMKMFKDNYKHLSKSKKISDYIIKNENKFNKIEKMLGWK